MTHTSDFYRCEHGRRTETTSDWSQTPKRCENRKRLVSFCILYFAHIFNSLSTQLFDFSSLILLSPVHFPPAMGVAKKCIQFHASPSKRILRNYSNLFAGVHRLSNSVKNKRISQINNEHIFQTLHKSVRRKDLHSNI